MRIPTNRIYSVRATARRPNTIRDPGLGGPARALAAGMAPAIKGAIGVLDQRIRSTLQAAKDPHWKTHVALAQQIARTGAETARAFGDAWERRIRSDMEKADGMYLDHINSAFFDHVDADGNLVKGGISRDWNAATGDGPVKALVDRDAEFDEDERFKGLHEEARRRWLEGRRDQLRQRYVNDAERAQIAQIRKADEADHRRLGDSLAAAVGASLGPDQGEEWLSRAGDLASFVADDAVPPRETAAVDPDDPESLARVERAAAARQAAYDEALGRCYDQRAAAWCARLASLGPDREEEAAALVSAMALDAENESAPRTEEQRIAVKTMYDNARRKRLDNIEAGYRAAEGDVDRAIGDYAIAAAGPKGAAERATAEAAANGAIAKLPAGARQRAAQDKWQARVDEQAASDFLAAGYSSLRAMPLPKEPPEGAGADARQAYDEAVRRRREADEAWERMTPAQRTAAGRMLDAQRDASAKRERDMAKAVSGWASGEAPMAPHDMARRLAEKRSLGVIDAGEYESGMREVRKAAAYERVFKGDADARKRHDAMVMQAVRAVFDGFGDGEMNRLFQWDKDGFLVYNDDGTPRLADGVAPTDRRRVLRSRSEFIQDRSLSGGRSAPVYVDAAASTVARAASLAREYITEFYMGNAPDGSKGASVDPERLRKYMADALGDETARVSDEAMSARIFAFVETMPSLSAAGMDMKNESRRILMGARNAGNTTGK